MLLSLPSFSCFVVAVVATVSVVVAVVVADGILPLLLVIIIQSLL